MSLVLRIAIATLCFCLPARAAENPGDANKEVGVGLICNTSQQVETLVKLLNDGQGMGDAVQAINTKAETPNACSLAIVAFTPGAPVSEQKLGDESVSIYQITVFAVSDGSNWQRVPDTVQYTVMQPKGEII